MEVLTILMTIIVVSLLVIVAMIYLMFRNEWVYKERMKLVHLDMNEYNRLPSYDEMMYKWFWCWNIEKMKGEPNEEIL